MAAVGGVAVDADWVGFGALTARRMLLRHARLGTNMPNHNPTDRRIGYVCLLATALGWGLNWPAMKVILRDWPPLLSRGVAGVIAAVLLAMVAVRRSESLRVPYRAVPRLLLAAFTNVFAWMGFTTLSMRWLSVAEGALLVYTMPIWATLFAWPLLRTRPTPRGFAGLLLGLAGVGVLLGGRGISLSPAKLTGISFALGAAVLFAFGTVLNRSPLPIPRVASVVWQVGLGCIPMLLLSPLLEAPNLAALTPEGAAVLAYMAVVPTGVCYLTWFATLRHLPPATASTGMLLVPPIGVISAAIMLGEPLGWVEVMAMGLILAGVTLALQK